MKDTGKIYIIIAAFFFSFTAVSQNKQTREYTAEEKKTVENFKKTIDITRERIDILQADAELHATKYFEEEKVIQEAEQVELLINDGHYIEVSKLENWITRLSNLAGGTGTVPKKTESNSIDRWNYSLERSDKAIAKGKETVLSGRERIKAAREKLEKLRREEIINLEVYNQRITLLERAIRQIDRLERNISNQEIQLDSIRRRGDKISKEDTREIR